MRGLDEILAHASGGEMLHLQGLARLQEILAQPCAYAGGICFDIIVSLEFVLIKKHINRRSKNRLAFERGAPFFYFAPEGK